MLRLAQRWALVAVVLLALPGIRCGKPSAKDEWLLSGSREAIAAKASHREQQRLALHAQRRLTPSNNTAGKPTLHFRDGAFKILQIADMHISKGAQAACQDLSLAQRWASYECSDTNTTDFVIRLLEAEDPDLVV